MMKRSVEKGITLIALVVTIVVLLILAGVSISMLTGENGIIKQATDSRIRQSHLQEGESIGLKYTEYLTDVRMNDEKADFMDYMKNKGYISDDGVIDNKNLIGSKLPLGNGSGRKDVYVLEETDDGFSANYYDKDEKPEEVWNTKDTSSDTTANAVRDEDMFEFDSTTGTILRIKEDCLVEYYDASAFNITYLDCFVRWCRLKEDIDTLIVPNSIGGVAVKTVKCLGITNVKNIIIEDGIESIDNIGSLDRGTDYDKIDIALERISIPKSVIYIGYSAFGNCDKLKSIKIDEENSKYDSRNNCNAIINKENNELVYGCKTTKIPSGVKSIGREAFFNCSGLTNVSIPEGVTSIGVSAFKYSGLKNIIVPDSVTSIGEEAFSNCYNLTTVSISNNLTSIEVKTFEQCYNLTSITIPDKITSIGYKAFYSCQNLTSDIKIPEGVTKIDDETFYYCKSLTNVSLPDSLKTINKYAFYRCNNLTNIEIPNNVTVIGDCAFFECNITSVKIPDGLTNIGREVFGHCANLSSIVVSGSNTKYDSRNNCNAIIDTQNNQIIYGCKATEIPEGVTSIGKYAFFGSDISTMTMPDSVTSIQEDAFCECKKLTSMVIGNNVKSIGNSAFYNCVNLTTILIPKSVTNIGGSAFSNCSNFTTVNYKGTEEEWKKIDIDYDNFALTNATINYNYQ